jgi:hypothetical protein
MNVLKNIVEDLETKETQELREFMNKRGRKRLTSAFWTLISYEENLSEDFIRKYSRHLNWNFISMKQKLSEDFIREFKNEIDWINISAEQVLSENFVEEFQNEVSWIYISRSQKLSDEFIFKFNDKIDFYVFLRMNNPSYSVIKKYLGKSNINELGYINTRNLTNQEYKQIEKIWKLNKLFKSN